MELRAAPADAATVVLLARCSGPDLPPRVYMAERSHGSRFMPGTWVFPGGRLEPEERAQGSDGGFARAARRECGEEAGVDLRGVELVWFDTWITPSAEPRRFLARFYLAEVAAAEARADGRELRVGAWKTAREHLDEWRRGAIDLPPPTLCTLLGLDGRTVPELLAGVPEDVSVPILPKLAADGRTVFLPHDPEYPELPGETGGRPPRVHRLPRRIHRRDGRWIPEEARPP